MDEIDSIGSARMESGSGNGDSEVQRTMLELLNQLDGFEASNKIKVQLSTFLFFLGENNSIYSGTSDFTCRAYQCSIRALQCSMYVS